MSNQSKLDNDVKFKPNYKWPKEGTEKKCPKLDEPLQLQKNLPQYYGKPWWCHFCQWQFSEDDLKRALGNIGQHTHGEGVYGGGSTVQGNPWTQRVGDTDEDLTWLIR